MYWLHILIPQNKSMRSLFKTYILMDAKCIPLSALKPLKNAAKEPCPQKLSASIELRTNQ